MSEKLTAREKIPGLKNRAKLLKSKLQNIKHWKTEFCKQYPEYDRIKWGMIINNVIYGRSTNEELLTALEAFVKSNGPKIIKPKINKQ